MGYCPQFGNFFPDFKGREMLEFFARLRGLKRSSRRREVEKWIKHMKLEVSFESFDEILRLIVNIYFKYFRRLKRENAEVTAEETKENCQQQSH